MRNELKILYIICFLLLLGSGDFQVRGLKVTGEDVPTEALRGEDVSIPCLLSDVPIPLNLQKVLVVWTQILLNGTEHEVYNFRSSHHQSWRIGSYMNDSDIAQGNASLYIPDIQITDEGDYVCFVMVTPDAGSGTSALHVSVKPQATLSYIKLFESTYLTIHVYCKVSKFYPEAVDIHWVKYSKMNGTNSSVNEDVSLTIPLRNSDGTFNVTSLLNVKPSSGIEPGDILFCIVNHRSLKEEITCSFTVPRRNPIMGISIAISVLGMLQMLFTFLIIIFKKRWRPWIAVFIIAIIIAAIILGCLYLYFMEGIDGVYTKSANTLFSVLVIFGLLLMGILGIFLWRYFKKGIPIVSDIFGDSWLSHMEQTTLSFQITEFRLEEIYINLYLKKLNDVENHLICSWASVGRPPGEDNAAAAARHQNGDTIEEEPLLENAVNDTTLPMKMKVKMTKTRNGSYICDCRISLTPNEDTDDSAVLAVEVDHAALEWPIYRYHFLNVIKGDNPSLWRRSRRRCMQLYDGIKIF